jgi:hypothetical protein
MGVERRVGERPADGTLGDGALLPLSRTNVAPEERESCLATITWVEGLQKNSTPTSQFRPATHLVRSESMMRFPVTCNACPVTEHVWLVTEHAWLVTELACLVREHACPVTGLECPVTGLECRVTGFECRVTELAPDMRVWSRTL